MHGTSTEQVVDKGIRQKSTKEWTHSLTAVPFVRGHRSVFPRTPQNTGVYTRHPTFVTATSGVLTRLPEKLSKNGMRVYTLSDRRSKKNLRVYPASEAKGLKYLLFLLQVTIAKFWWKNFLTKIVVKIAKNTAGLIFNGGNGGNRGQLPPLPLVFALVPFQKSP